jgi:Predicted dehydrogenases and related proteins
MPQHSILIVGCGSIGERHLRCFKKSGRARVTACDTNPALLKKMVDTYAVPTTDRWQDALKAGFDAVVICTPAPSHVGIATQAMEAGAHVLIEKPLSHSLAGIDELIATRDRRRRQAAVAYVLHAYPVLCDARDFLRSGHFGPIRQATVVTGQPFHLFRPAYAESYYRDRNLGGGAIQDALTHSVNWIESILGPSESVLCDCAHQVLAGVDVEDTVHVSLRHPGALSNFSLNQFQAPNETTFQFNAAGGSVKIELHHQRWGTFAIGATAWDWRIAAPLDRDGPFLNQANAFLDQLEGKPSRLCSVEAALTTLRFNLAALASAESGHRVACAPARD